MKWRIEGVFFSKHWYKRTPWQFPSCIFSKKELKKQRRGKTQVASAESFRKMSIARYIVPFQTRQHSSIEGFSDIFSNCGNTAQAAVATRSLSRKHGFKEKKQKVKQTHRVSFYSFFLSKDDEELKEEQHQHIAFSSSRLMCSSMGQFFSVFFLF